MILGTWEKNIFIFFFYFFTFLYAFFFFFPYTVVGKRKYTPFWIAVKTKVTNIEAIWRLETKQEFLRIILVYMIRCQICKACRKHPVQLLIFWLFGYKLLWKLELVRSSYYVHQNRFDEFLFCFQFSNLFYLCYFWFYGDSKRCILSFADDCITLVNFWFHPTIHSFSPRDVIFGLRGPFTIRK